MKYLKLIILTLIISKNFFINCADATTDSLLPKDLVTQIQAKQWDEIRTQAQAYIDDNEDDFDTKTKNRFKRAANSRKIRQHADSRKYDTNAIHSRSVDILMLTTSFEFKDDALARLTDIIATAANATVAPKKEDEKEV